MEPSPAPGEPEAIAGWLRWGTDLLLRRGLGEARLDAEVLLADLLGWGRASLLARDERLLAEPEAVTYRDRILRRSEGEPVAYLTGKREFFSLEFRVDPRVMIPRPETEFVADEAVRFLRSQRGGEGVVADIGTGSGAIAISVAHTVPGCRVIASDTSPGALEVARENARRLGVHDRIEFVEGDLDAPVRAAVGAGALDALLCNPPYVDRTPGAVDPAVERYEPAEAVFARGDPLEIYRRLCGAALDLLAPGGLIACEVAAGQAPAVREIFRARGAFATTFTRPDLSGIERVVGALRNETEGGADG